MNRFANWLLERPLIYSTWQRAFAEAKLAPVLRRGEIARARRVLDVGCGPGTNVRHFTNVDYLGVDINSAYVASATRRYKRRFVVADVTKYSAAAEGKFDFVFMNSLMHHLDTSAVRRLLSHVATLLTDDGHVHVLDLVLPAEQSVSRALAQADRGAFPRPLEEWRALFGEALDVDVFEPYPLGFAGVTLWNMVYCKGRSKR